MLTSQTQHANARAQKSILRLWKPWQGFLMGTTAGVLTIMVALTGPTYAQDRLYLYAIATLFIANVLLLVLGLTESIREAEPKAKRVALAAVAGSIVGLFASSAVLYGKYISTVQIDEVRLWDKYVGRVVPIEGVVISKRAATDNQGSVYELENNGSKINITTSDNGPEIGKSLWVLGIVGKPRFGYNVMLEHLRHAKD